MRTIKKYFATLVLVLPMLSFSQKVENIHFEQVGKQIHIYYDLQGDHDFTVNVFCSTNNGQTWGGPLKYVTGAVGENQKPGNGKMIVWDVLKERDKLLGNIMFKIELTTISVYGSTFIDKNLIRLATQNRDSVLLRQKARLDTLMKDSGKRYAIQDAMDKFNKGMDFYENKDFPAALEQFKLALATIPENSKLNYYLGLLYFEKAEYDLSLSYYSNAVRFDPLDSLALLGAGQVYFIKGDHLAAMELYNLSVQVGKNYSTAYYNRGTLLGMNKNYIDALADLNRAIELDPSNGNAFVNRGNAYFMLKQANSACRDWKIAADMGEPNGIASYEKYCK